MMVLLIHKEVIQTTPYELLELINEKYSDEETIQILNELIETIDENSKRYIYKLSEEVVEFALSRQLCPLCSEKLIVTSHEEEREYQGFICTEKIYTTECINPQCSYTNK